MDFAYVYFMKCQNPSAKKENRHTFALYQREMSRELLSKCFIEKLGEYPLPQIEYDKAGKPFLKHSDLCVSFSHCSDAVACAVSNCEIGIDIETVFPSVPHSCDYFLSQNEKQWAFQHTPSIPYLTMLWSMKEAYGKHLGIGLRYPFSKTNFCFEFDTLYHFDGNYAICKYNSMEGVVLSSWSKILPQFFLVSHF